MTHVRPSSPPPGAVRAYTASGRRLTSDGDWIGYGVTWVRSAPVAGTPIPKCGTCGHGGDGWVEWSSRAEDGATVKGVAYTISDRRRVIAQNIDSAGDAAAFALAPKFIQFVAHIADDDPMTGEDGCRFCCAYEDSIPGVPTFVAHELNCLWRRARELMAELNKPLHVWGLGDKPSTPTTTPL